jgi:flagellar M-ring protein FliF
VNQLISVWAGLDTTRRTTVVAATLGMFAAVYFLSQAATQPRMALLYAGLDASTAGEVVTALEAKGALVEVRGPAIYVNAAERDALRLALAGEGLPRNGAQGYELLDALTGFGTTAQMFDATYWRAKEGELARTITANHQFSAARVHISNPASDPFRKGQVEAASVSVTMASGSMTPGQAMAIRYLVASAVAGLEPENVSVIDSVNGLVSNGTDPASRAAGISDDRAEALRNSVTRLLEARVGPGRAVVEVTVDPVTEREEFTERRFDPDGRVPISSDSEETTTSSSGTGSGGVTVASNLPDGDAGGANSSSQSNETRTREVVNFEVSETQRAVIREPGSIRRISVAVLVDGVTTQSEGGTPEWQARSEQELADLRELVASAIGYNVDRGDQITIRSMQFQPPPAFDPPEPPGLLARLSFDAMGMAQLAVLAVVSLVLGLFVVRPILLRAPAQTTAALAPPDPSLAPADASSPGELPSLPALDGEIDGGFAPLGELPSFDSINANTDPAARLRELIEEKQDETVEVLSQWMGDPQEARR